MDSKTIGVILTAALLTKIDEAAQANGISRSAYIREAVILRLNDQRIVSKPSDEDFLDSLAKLAE